MQTTKFFKLKLKPVIRYILSFVLLFILFFPLVHFTSTLDAKTANDWWETAKQGGLDKIGQQAYNESGNPKDIRIVVVDMIKIFLSILGITLLIIILYGGFRWMTAGGNEENVTTARKIIIAGIIGLIIVLCAYAIADFVVNKLLESTGTIINE